MIVKRLVILVVLAVICFAGVVTAGGAGSSQLFFGYSALTNDGMPALTSFRTRLFGLGYSPYVGSVGFRYFVNDLWAFRGGLNLGYVSSDIKIENDLGEGTGTDSQYGFSFIFEKYFTPVASVSPYIGFGFAYQYGKAKYDGVDILMDSGEEICVEFKANEYHIPVPMGFNWQASDRFSFGGEVTLDYIYYTIDQSMGEMPKTEYSGSTFGFYGATAFLAVNF
jgi:hypothetical protein